MPEDMFKPDETSLSQSSQEKLEDVLAKQIGRMLISGEWLPNHIEIIATAINSLTLKQAKGLIGEDEPESYTADMSYILKRQRLANRERNQLRAELRASAERIWKT